MWMLHRQILATKMHPFCWKGMMLIHRLGHESAFVKQYENSEYTLSLVVLPGFLRKMSQKPAPIRSAQYTIVMHCTKSGTLNDLTDAKNKSMISGYVSAGKWLFIRWINCWPYLRMTGTLYVRIQNINTRTERLWISSPDHGVVLLAGGFLMDYLFTFKIMITALYVIGILPKRSDHRFNMVFAKLESPSDPDSVRTFADR